MDYDIKNVRPLGKRGQTSKEVDCTNDKEMIEEALRAPHLVIDRSVFVHTPYEKAKLKELRAEAQFNNTSGYMRRKTTGETFDFLVHFKNEKGLNHFNTTKRYKSVTKADTIRILNFYKRKKIGLVKAVWGSQSINVS